MYVTHQSRVVAMINVFFFAYGCFGVPIVFISEEKPGSAESISSARFVAGAVQIGPLGSAKEPTVPVAADFEAVFLINCK